MREYVYVCVVWYMRLCGWVSVYVLWLVSGVCVWRGYIYLCGFGGDSVSLNMAVFTCMFLSDRVRVFLYM